MKKKIVLGVIIILLLVAVIAEGVIIFMQYNKDKNSTNKTDENKSTIEETIKEDLNIDKMIFDDDTKNLIYTDNIKDDVNGKIAILKQGEKIFQTEKKDKYYVYIDNFENEYYIKKITDIDSKFEMMGNNDLVALFKVTITYKNNSNKTKSFDVAVMINNDERKDVDVVAPYEEFTGSTRFVKNFTDLYDEENKTISETEIVKGNDYKLGEYEYKIPQIDIDSEEIDKINKEISKKWEEPVINTKNSNKNNINDIVHINHKSFVNGHFYEENIHIYGSSYKYAVNDGILSLIISGFSDSGFMSSDVYNINVNTNKKVTNTELLNLYGFSVSDVRNMLDKAIEKLAEKYNELGYYYDNDYNRHADIAKEWTQFQDVENIKLFINSEGHLCSYTHMTNMSCVGGEDGFYIFDLETGDSITKDYFEYEY